MTTGRLLLIACLPAAAGPSLSGGVPPLAAQETHVLVVTGLGGEPEFRTRFREWGAAMADAALEAGVSRDRIVFLAEDPDADPDRIRARSTREEVEGAFRTLSEWAAPEDRVLVFLAGHGSGSGEESRVSLPGPSLRAADYAALAAALPARSVAFVIAASGSGDFVPVLSGEGRVVITATRSAAQRNASVFGGHFAAAFADGTADLDRDGRVSLLEAFEYARRETERHYRDRGLIPTEEALLEDSGAGRGAATPMEDPGTGALAARFVLEPGRAPAAVAEGEAGERLRALHRERERLEEEVEALGTRREGMDPGRYREDLEALLVELARVGREIRRLEEGGR